MSLAGKLLLWGYHQPVGLVRQSWRHGGPIAQWRTRLGRKEMEAAATRLPALPEFRGTTPVTLHLLTGRRFWYQTVFCLHSFAHFAARTIDVELYDDGTIDAETHDKLAALGSRLRVHAQHDLRARLETQLPRGRFPALHERWLNYPNIRKLIDVHLGGGGWKLVLDSDLLFFRPPDRLLEWLDHPHSLLCARDSAESYGYSRTLLERLAAVPLPHCLNVGVCGLESSGVDWDLLESWTRQLIAEEGTHYYLEQALVAMMAARLGTWTMLPASDYVTHPAPAEAHAPSAVMHHYVDTSKRWYFGGAWKRVAGLMAPNPGVSRDGAR